MHHSLVMCTVLQVNKIIIQIAVISLKAELHSLQNNICKYAPN